MTGAISLAGMAALRGGAGLVTLAVPDCCLDVAAGFEPSYMTTGLPCDPQGRFAAEARDPLVQLASAATCVALGPGLGRSDATTRIVDHLYRTLTCPIVLDADGLNALADGSGRLPPAAGKRILTPHPGEFRRLVGNADQASMTEQARQLAANHRAVVVLKGHRTLITDGAHSWNNPSGNPGMATGGSGDILTGVITALVCQGLPAVDAARLGVYVHGRAGDLAADDLGQIGMLARDLVAHLPAALQEVESDPA